MGPRQRLKAVAERATLGGMPAPTVVPGRVDPIFLMPEPGCQLDDVKITFAVDLGA